MTVGVVLLALAGCGHDSSPDDTGWDTLESCVLDRVANRGEGTSAAIRDCCLDEPIGGLAAGTPCGDSQARCVGYVEGNLDSSTATQDQITTACADFISVRLP